MSPRKTLRAAALLAAGAALALPAGAQAAESTSLVTGTAVSELSLGVSTPAVLNLSHAAPATTSSVVTVTSTNLAWTLSIADNNAATNAGKMLKTAGATSPAVGTPLANALQWSSDASTFSDLTGANATVGAGTLVGTKTVTLRQALGATEAVTAGDAYALTLKYTAN